MKPSRFRFRAWSPSNKAMFNCNGIATNLGDSVIPILMDWRGHPMWMRAPCEFIVMQSTGLVDKNGVEIYEGDIVRGIFVAGLAHIRTLFVVRADEIKYPQNLSFIAIGDPYDNRLDPPNDENTDEVIGNIYENPELLK